MLRTIFIKNFSDKIISCSILLIIITKFQPLLSQQPDKAEKTSLQDFLALNQENLFTPLICMESWLTYSMGEEKNGEKFENRADVLFRRFRLGAKGSPYNWLGYSFQISLDRLGEDSYAATKSSCSGPNIWNAYISAKLLQKSDLLYLNAGYYWAVISRETQYSSWAVGSFDKTRADWYLRDFTTGRGNGIESGIGIAGIKNFNKFGISYLLNTFEPSAFLSSEYASRLYTGRLMVSFLESEFPKYSYLLCGNQWRKRTGVTLGFGASTQSNGKINDTLFYTKSNTFGADILINYVGLSIDGQYYLLSRSAESLTDFEGALWHIRMAYTFETGKTFFEPCISYENYEGTGPNSIYTYTGEDETLDIGVNWYLNKDKLKLALHYIYQNATVSTNVGDYYGVNAQFRL
ncbi:MAG: hypothetical protein JXA77_09270 [Bacteroidales bacterium]|nr:hypothetical protein [Bacteroidales bacterium]MBN2818713.1 hypothetical protein [Bacteroidales bacterium]